MCDQQWITDDGLTLVEVVPYLPAFVCGTNQATHDSAWDGME